MEAKNLGGAILGGVIAGASLGVGFIIAQRGMSKIGKKDMVSTRPMVIEGDEFSNAISYDSRTINNRKQCFRVQTDSNGNHVSTTPVNGIHCQGLAGGSGLTNQWSKR
jgi:hypothetical protein